MRIPSVELIGKNANGRDVTLRVAIDHLPMSDEQWYQKAVEAGLPADLDKSLGNITVGNHNGFGGAIKSFDPLSHVNRAVSYVRNIERHWDNPEAVKKIFQRYAHMRGVHVLDVFESPDRPAIMHFDTWRDLVVYAGRYYRSEEGYEDRAVLMEGLFDHLSDTVSWQDLINRMFENMWAYDLADNQGVWLIIES